MKKSVTALLLLGLGSNAIAAGIDDVYAANDRGDYDEEVRLLQPLVQQGLPAAQSMLGYLYSVGHGVPLDSSKAVEWLTKAGNGGYAGAMTYLAWMYESGSGIPKSDADALKWYRKAADAGDTKARESVQRLEQSAAPASQSQDSVSPEMQAIYEAGGRGDYDTAVRLVMPLAEQGVTRAQAYLGWLYYSGHGFGGEDNAKALVWLLKAAAKGNVDAEQLAADLYLYGYSGVEFDREKALAMLHDAADKGNAAAKSELECVAQGEASSKVRDQVQKADSGNAMAQWRVGRAYLRGTGCYPQNDVKGLRYVIRSGVDGTEDTGFKSAVDEKKLKLPLRYRADAQAVMREQPRADAPVSPISKDVKKTTKLWVLSHTGSWSEVAIPDLGAGFIAWIPDAALNDRGN